MKNSEYWEKRIANNTWIIYNSLEEKNKAILELYHEAYLSLIEELYRVTEKINGGQPTLTDMHKLNRLSRLEKKFEDIIESLVDNVETLSKDSMFKAFLDNYENIMASLDIEDFAEVDKALMEEILRQPWQGGHFSERLWNNTSVLANNLNEHLTQGLIQGKTIAEISINLSNLMQQGFNVTHRLVRTETMRYLNQSSKRAYKDAGVNKVQVWAAIDERTCKICGVKHGNIYKVEDAPQIPFHANCRCTILPIIFEEDAIKDHDKSKGEVNTEFKKREDIIKNKQKEKKNKEDKVIRKVKEDIRNGFYNTKLNKNHYEKHIKGTKRFLEYERKQKSKGLHGPSYLTLSHDEAQSLVNKYAGTGIMRTNRKGEWDKKELIIDCGMDIGYNIDMETGEAKKTKAFKIHYSKTGVHIVPSKGKEE